MKLTNEEIYKIAASRIRHFKASDYRPLLKLYIPDRQGIVIWGTNGDAIIYFPREADHED